MPYKNKEDELRRMRSRNRKTRIDGQRIVKEAKSVPCKDCGKKFHYCAMDFDHVRGKKRFTIGPLKALGCSIQRLLDEIAKCEVVCANCHRVRTFKRNFIEKPDGTLVFNPGWQFKGHKRKTHCPQGHPYKGKNLVINNSGAQCCRICREASWKKARAKKLSSRDNWLERYSNGSKRKVPFKIASDGRLVLDRKLEAH